MVDMVTTWLAALAEKEKEVNTMYRIKVGIVGAGYMAVAHIRAYHQVDGVEIAALCNPSGRHLDGDFSDVHGNVGSDEPVKLDMTNIAAYRGLKEMLADESIDLIDITTPTFLHREQTLAALTAGKHVLCEKPMASNAEEARQMQLCAQVAHTHTHTHTRTHTHTHTSGTIGCSWGLSIGAIIRSTTESQVVVY